MSTRKPPLIEALEDRRLLSAWGLFPRLIDQDVARMSYPDITGAGTSIAILDAGVGYNHPALGGGFGPGRKVIAGYDFVDNDADPIDVVGHGTGAAGVAAASTFTLEGAQYQGIAPGANIIALRTDNGSDDFTTDSGRIHQALQWILAHRDQYNIVAVNISTGSGFYSDVTSINPCGADFAALAAAGVFVAASAGNDGVTNPPSVEYPAADPNVCGVGAINSANQISSFSSRASILDLLAPGENVPTTYLNQSRQPIYLKASGTSFSSPMAAGAAALIKQINPGFTPAQIVSILQDSGVPIFDAATGQTYPRLDLAEALALAYQRSGRSRPVIGGHGTDSDVTYDGANRLYAAWYDAAEGNIKFDTRSPGGVWSSLVTIDDSADVGHYPSVALNSVGLPAVAYYDSTNGDLKYARFDGRRWRVSTIDTFRTTGLYPSLVFNSSDGPAITYYDKTHGVLKLASWSGTRWNLSTVDGSRDVGRYSSLAINPGNGRFAVAYVSTTAGQFRFAELAKSGWQITTVDDTPADGGYVSLGFDKFNQPGFSYYDAWNADLKFAHFTGGRWRVAAVATNGSQGLYSNLMFDPDTGKAWISYYNRNGDSLWVAMGDIGSWQYYNLISGAGRSVSSFMSPSGTITSVFQGTNSDDLHLFEF